MRVAGRWAPVMNQKGADAIHSISWKPTKNETARLFDLLCSHLNPAHIQSSTFRPWTHYHSTMAATPDSTPTPPVPAEIEQQIPLKSQVGGHPGVMSSADGSTIIKPCKLAEKAFYEAMYGAPDGSAMALLRTLCPEFRGATEDGNVSRPSLI